MFLIDRATKDDDHARYAEKMDKSVSSVENAPNICDENHCSIVAGILVQTIVHGAHIETLEDFSKGEL